MEQYSLFMRVARILISWTASRTVVAWSITMVSHVTKSYAGLARPMVFWTRSARVSGVVSTCADGQRFESLNQWTLNVDLKRQIHIFVDKYLRSTMGYRWKDQQLAYYQLSPPTSSPAIWACGTLPSN